MTEKSIMIRLDNIEKKFGGISVVKKMSLTVYKGEMLTLLGSSGCGKSTTLNMITGSLKPDSGNIFIDDKDVTNLPSYRREIGLVFQNFALFPHMTVFENVEFPLKVRRENKERRKEKAMEMLHLVKLDHLASRYPRELSGGQQQRVGLARAMVYRPQVVLFDEPLSNLDAKLRGEMRYEIMNLKEKLGFTSIYVTHDQEEALTMSDRIAVLKDGVIQQTGTPSEIYNEPETAFVADFVGISNKVCGHCLEINDGFVLVDLKGIHIKGVPAAEGIKTGDEVSAFIRTEDITLSSEIINGENVLQGEVKNISFLGERKEYLMTVAGGENLRFYTKKESTLAIRQQVFVSFQTDKCKIFRGTQY